MESKKRKQSEILLGFLQKKHKPEPPPTVTTNEISWLASFEIKDGMTLAPIHGRPPLTESEKKALLSSSDEVSDDINGTTPHK